MKKLHDLEKGYLDERIVEEFKREADLCCHLANHPNIVGKFCNEQISHEKLTMNSSKLR